MEQNNTKSSMDEYRDTEPIDYDDISNKYLTFELSSPEENSKIYGIEMKDVIEIVSMQPISEVPYSPDFIKGIINLRGRIVPLIDINDRFGFADTPYNERTCVIVVSINENYIGLIVNLVYEVINVRDISPLPKEIDKTSNKFVYGIAQTEKYNSILIMDTKLVTCMEEPLAI